MRRKSRKDLNHDAVVEAFRKCGCYVVELHELGHGIPDLLVKIGQTWRVVEIKNMDGWYGRQGLNKAQRAFNEECHGQVDLVSSVDDALKLIGTVRERRCSDA